VSALLPSTVRRLSRRRRIAIDPARSIAIKRSVHEFEIEAEASRFAAALREVMIEPQAVFGLVEVARASECIGQAFTVGERFLGCIRLARLAERWRKRRPVLARMLAALARTRMARWLEENMLSDFAEVTAIDDAQHRVTYAYLSGNPMAGASTFEVLPLGPGCCRFRAVFHYQERHAIGISVLNRFGIAMHDEVTHAQVVRAAARVQARVRTSTVQPAYAESAAARWTPMRPASPR
jgi:hypothetical protein